MASSQVEIVSSSPFGSLLRNHSSRRERWGRESNAHEAIQKNLQDLVQSCISVSPRKSDLESNADSVVQNDKSKNHDKWAKAREMVFQKDDGSAEVPNIRAVSSLVQRWRDFEAVSKNLKLNGNNNSNNNANSNSISSTVCSSRSNSGSTFTETASFHEAPIKNSEISESVEEKFEVPVEEKFETPTMAEESFMDWESDRTVPSGPPSTRSIDSNATENERIRVADIIKRLKQKQQQQQHQGNGEECNGEQFVGNDSLPRLRVSIDHAPEMRGFGAVVASPRIRGRQAFNDLLMRMERDRQKEIEGLGEHKAVSGFSHQGRIQALLKVRSLRHGLEVKNSGKMNLIASERNKASQVSSIKHLRERFNTVENSTAADSSPRKVVIHNTQDVEKSSSSNQLKEVVVDHTPKPDTPLTSNQLKEETRNPEVTNPKKPQRNVIDGSPEVQTCPNSNCLRVNINHQDFTTPQQNTSQIQNSKILEKEASPSLDITTPQLSTSQFQNSKNIKKEASPSLDVMWEVTSYDRNVEQQESLEKAVSPNGWKFKNQERMVNKEQSIASLHDWVKGISPSSQCDCEDQEATKGHLVETGPDWTSDFSQEPSEWEEEQETYNQDWIYDIARPRSDWEDLRQERYQEMLDPSTDKGDIKQLLERRSVSSFLSSGLREIIDQLMISRTQVQPTLINNHQVEEPREEEEVVGEEKMEEHEQNEQEEEEGAEPYEEVEEEDKSSIGGQYCEAGEYFDRTPSSLNSGSPSLFRSWSRNQDHDASDDSYSSPSPSPSQSCQQSLSLVSYPRENQECSSFRNHHPSVEMELLYDMRGHMEQLHQEIYDLRKSLKSCINLQMKMQRSMEEDAADSASHSSRKKGNESINRPPRKGTCCHCCEAEVDSLLYRCGHMCTCFKCGQELQWASGKCPICRAPILDVVRAYPGYR